jgi:hypothetical protein
VKYLINRVISFTSHVSMKAVIDRCAKAKEEQLGDNNATSELMVR